MSRVWVVNDPIAEHRGDHWRKGTVTDANKWRISVRWDDTEHACFRTPTDPRLVDPDEVPVDERRWLPAAVRDLLVRQEAAARLRVAWATLPGDFEQLLDVAHHLDGFDGSGGPDLDRRWAAAARELLGLPETAEAPPGGGPATPMEPR